MEKSLMTKRKKAKKKFPGDLIKRPSIGADLHHLDVDKAITFDNKYDNRRALKLSKKNNSWGFTLQTYGIKHKKTNEIQVMTYIDYVDIDGAAWLAGMRRGDVILAVNGEKVGSDTHKQLVNKIRQTDDTLRLVVHFEDCCKKVELHERFLKLKAVLRSKIQELREIELEEINILEKCYEDRGVNRFDMMRQSIVSNVSSNSDSWDAYSVISSPYTNKSTGQFQYGPWSSVSSIRSLNIDEASSICEEESMDYIDSDSDSLTLQSGMSCTRSSESDLVTYNGGLKGNQLNVQTTRLSRSFDAGLNKKHNSGFIKEQESSHKHVVDDAVFLDDPNEYLVKYEETEKSYIYPAGSQLHRNESVRSDDKIYYKGENGKMIVPKICVEGKLEYTTFDHIDTQCDMDHITDEDPEPSVNGTRLQPGENERLHEKIVAMEIAREMSRIEKMVQRSEQNLVKDIEANTKTRKSSPKRIQKSKSQPIHKTNPALIKTGLDIKYRGIDLSPRLSRSNMAHIGGSLSYEKLKSSVPDIVMPFHAEDYQIVYINEGDQQTKL